MFSQYKSVFLAVIIAVFIYEFSSSESSNFTIDRQHMNEDQRDRLFLYLDTNSDNNLSENEFIKLYPILFYSTKMKKSYKVNEEMFDLLDFNNDKIIDKIEFQQIWDNWIQVILKPRSALIVVDVQNDFIHSKGKLRVPNAITIIDVINKLIETINFETIVYTYDWHPSNHCSFVDSVRDRSIKRDIIESDIKSLNETKCGDWVKYKNYPNITQTLWPSHCVANTWGAQLYSGLNITNNSINIEKGTDPDIDSYSAFQDNAKLHRTALDFELKKIGITDVYLSGVVYEYCVGKTALDALSLDYRTVFVEDAIHELHAINRTQMRNSLISLSANVTNSEQISDMVDARDTRPEMGFVLARKVNKRFRKNETKIDLNFIY